VLGRRRSFARPLSKPEINAIAAKSAQNNVREGNIGSDDKLDYIRIGRYVPRGKSEKVEIYTLDDPVLRFDPKKTHIKDLIEEFRRAR